MKSHRLAALCAALVMTGLTAAPAQAAAPTTWDGLTLVKSKKLDRVYLLPGADFRPYTKVMLDPTEVAFQKNWLRDYNSSQMGQGQRMTQAQADQIVQAVSTGMNEVFAKAYQDAGYQVVTTPGPDVLRMRTGVLNLSIAAPDQMTAGRSRTFSSDAGQATLVLEARDSQTGALLGRALDNQVVGDTGAYLRNSVTNRSDFQRVFVRWAKASIDGLQKLKAASPLGSEAVANR